MEEPRAISPKPNLINQSQAGYSMSRRRLLARQEPTVHVCEWIEELSIIFDAQMQACRELAVPIALVVIEIMNFDNLTIESDESPDSVVNRIAHHLLSVVRAQDVIVQFNSRFIACLLSDADQVAAAKICQRIKESVHNYSYLHHSLCPIQLDFGVSDDSNEGSAELTDLMFAAATALNFAHQLGDGAVVRSSDLDQSIEASTKEHFCLGDRLSSRKA